MLDWWADWTVALTAVLTEMQMAANSVDRMETLTVARLAALMAHLTAEQKALKWAV